MSFTKQSLEFSKILFQIALINLITRSQCSTETDRLSYERVRISSGIIRGVVTTFPYYTHLPSVTTYLGVDYGIILKRKTLFRFLPASNLIPNRRADFLDSTSYKGVCPQPARSLEDVPHKASHRNLPEYVRNVQTEECLNLNIFAPEKGN